MSLAAQLCRLVRPYTARELPGWGRVLKHLKIAGIDNVNPRWRNAPTVRMRGKGHGYLMELDLSDDLERFTYFLGRYYDLELQLLLCALLHAGDTFVDVGANVGMTTLHGAKCVTEQGHVIAFEPQPACCRKIERNLRLNTINHVTLHNVALADEDGELRLVIPGGGTIMAHIDQRCLKSNVKQIRVPVRRGDEFISEIPGRLIIKIDVEGYELPALRGLINTLMRYRPSIISELITSHLERAGTSEHQAFQFFHDLDYVGYEVSLYKKGLFGMPSVRLREVPRATISLNGYGENFLWLPANEPAWRWDIADFVFLLKLYQKYRSAPTRRIMTAPLAQEAKASSGIIANINQSYSGPPRGGPFSRRPANYSARMRCLFKGTLDRTYRIQWMAS